jgi:outer membrane murein-binding lipoprotein Lpp
LQAFIEQLASKVQQLASQLSTLQNDQRYVLQSGDLINLEKHFAKEEMGLLERKRVLDGEALK